MNSTQNDRGRKGWTVNLLLASAVGGYSVAVGQAVIATCSGAFALFALYLLLTWNIR